MRGSGSEGLCVRNDILTNPLVPLFFAVSCFTERCVSMKPGPATAGCYRAQDLKSHACLIQLCISMLKMVMLNFLTTLNSYLQVLSLCCQDKWLELPDKGAQYPLLITDQHVADGGRGALFPMGWSSPGAAGRGCVRPGAWAPRLLCRAAGLCLTSTGGRQDWQVPTVSSRFVSLDFLCCEELKILMQKHIYEENIPWLEVIITAMCKTFQQNL